MKLYYLMLLLLYWLTLVSATQKTLEEILLTDIFGDVLLDAATSDKCNPSSSSGTFSFSYTLSLPYFDSQLIPQEENLFLAEIEHVDPSPEKSWKTRIGKGGNIYSFVSANGESLPLNRKENMYMVDEVWQNVVVNSTLNNAPGDKRYFIHQAGVYQKDGDYTSDPYFFSPTIAKWCSSTKKECRFASWGQQADVPTKYISRAIYVTRYRDCGDGVLELTSIIHNAENSEARDLQFYSIEPKAPRWNYMSFPWLSMNSETYKDFLIKENGAWRTQHPNYIFSQSPKLDLRDSEGYSVFSEWRRERDPFQFPGYWSDPAAEPDFIVGLLGTPSGVDPYRPCQPFRSFSESLQVFHVRCRLYTEKTYNGKCTGCELTFSNNRTSETLDVVNIVHWSFKSSCANCIHKDHHHIYFAPKYGVPDGSNTAVRFTSDTYDSDFAEQVANYVNNFFQEYDEISIEWTDSMLEDSEQHALAFVHGVDQDIRPGEVQQYWGGYAKIQWGDCYNYERQCFILNEIQNLWIDPGIVFGKNQYVILDKGLNAITRAQNWVQDVIQDYNVIGDLPYTSIDLLLTESGSIGIALDNNPCKGTIVCSGSSTPQPHAIGGFTIPHFMVKCGSNQYFGPDLYHFAHMDTNGIIRSYICDINDNNTRPEYKLVGYFGDGECSALENKVLDQDYCLADGRLTETPSVAPSESLRPSKSPTESSIPSFRPSKSPQPSEQPSTSFLPNRSHEPSYNPSKFFLPTSKPSTFHQPSLIPTRSHKPSNYPSKSFYPTSKPSHSIQPFSAPSRSREPSYNPSKSPQPSSKSTRSNKPSYEPSKSFQPTSKPSHSHQPSPIPTRSHEPSYIPSKSPQPSSKPSRSYQPSEKPSKSPQPSSKPSRSSQPSNRPSKSPQPYSKPSIAAHPSFAPSVSLRFEPELSNLPVALYPSARPSNTPKKGTPKGKVVRKRVRKRNAKHFPLARRPLNNPKKGKRKGSRRKGETNTKKTKKLKKKQNENQKGKQKKKQKKNGKKKKKNGKKEKKNTSGNEKQDGNSGKN